MVVFISIGADNVSTIVSEITNLVEMLPENEQNLAFELVKRIVLAWDIDYTKLTPAERQRLDEAEKDFINGETFSHEDIDWN